MVQRLQGEEGVLEIAYNDYVAFAYLNGERRRDKEEW